MSYNKKLQMAQGKGTSPDSFQIRNGDWICLICCNYNFSFREQCNRCQSQSKVQNQFQDFMLNARPSGPVKTEPGYKQSLESKFSQLTISTESERGFQKQVLLSSSSFDICS